MGSWKVYKIKAGKDKNQIESKKGKKCNVIGKQGKKIERRVSSPPERVH
jgi:hypothetical protein